MIHRNLSAGLLFLLTSVAIADVDPRSYLDPSLQANVVMGSATYYNNYFNADGEQTSTIPATVACLAQRNVKALQEALAKCNKDVANGRDSAANLQGAAQAFGAVQDSADTVSDNVDVIGKATEKLKEVAGYGEDLSRDQASRNKRQKNNAGADKWNKRADKCKSATKKIGKALGKVNLAKETADWVSWTCECAQAYCSDWEKDILEEVADTTGACNELTDTIGQWNELEQQAEGSGEACED